MKRQQGILQFTNKLHHPKWIWNTETVSFTRNLIIITYKKKIGTHWTTCTLIQISVTGQYPLTRISLRLYCCLCECPTLGPTCAGLCVSGLGLHYTKCILWQGQSRGRCQLHTFTYTCPSGTLSLSWSKAFRLCWDFSGLQPHGVAVRSGSPSALVPLLEEHQLSRNTVGLWALPAFGNHMCGSVSNSTQFFFQLLLSCV